MVSFFARTPWREFDSIWSTDFSKANELLQSHIEFLNYAKEINTRNREKLFMGFGLSSFQQVPKWINQFHQQFSECEVVINHLPSSAQMKMLLEGRLHIGFVRMPVSKGLASYIFMRKRWLLLFRWRVIWKA